VAEQHLHGAQVAGAAVGAGEAVSVREAVAAAYRVAEARLSGRPMWTRMGRRSDATG
jgi:hypothetical protein